MDLELPGMGSLQSKAAKLIDKIKYIQHKALYNNLTNLVKMIRNKTNSFSFIWKTAASGYI